MAFYSVHLETLSDMRGFCYNARKTIRLKLKCFLLDRNQDRRKMQRIKITKLKKKFFLPLF